MDALTEAPIKEIEISKINPAKYNPRRRLTPSDKEYQDIKTSLTTWGLVVPLVWNQQTGTLVGGHQRLNVIKRELKGTTKVTCAVVDLDETQEKAMNLALNKLGEGLWSAGKVATILAELDGKRIDPLDLGFSEEEVQKILKKPTGRAPKRDKDSAPAPTTKPVTKHGDVWHLMGPDGNPQHRILCGDATDGPAYDTLFQDRRAHAVITDPPYGVSYTSTSKSGKMARTEIKNDELRGPILQKFLTEMFQHALLYTETNVPIYCFYASRCHIEFEQAMREAEWEVRQQLIWAKRMALGRSNYHWAHEPILYGGKQGSTVPYHGDRAQTTMLEEGALDIEAIKGMKKAELVELMGELLEAGSVMFCQQEPPSTYIHPTQKPVALLEKIIGHATLPKQDIFDPFLGSGSTLIAAEITGRNLFGMELEPGHCDAMVRRYVETFEEVLIYRNGKEANPNTLQKIDG